MISNGWLKKQQASNFIRQNNEKYKYIKKGKIPVKYSQPIHRKYVYKINRHSKTEWKIIS